MSMGKEEIRQRKIRNENPYGTPNIPEIKKSLTVSKEELILKKHYGVNYESYFKNNSNIGESI